VAKPIHLLFGELSAVALQKFAVVAKRGHLFLVLRKPVQWCSQGGVSEKKELLLDGKKTGNPARPIFSHCPIMTTLQHGLFHFRLALHPTPPDDFALTGSQLPWLL
jgi:hypothetical protein